MRKFIFTILILLLPVICFPQSGWFTQNSGTSYNLNDIFFIDGKTGWAVGDSGTVVKTINGGFSWYHQNSNTRIRLSKVHFANAKTGWASGGIYQVGSPCWNSSIVIATTNGGTSWFTQAESGIGFLTTDLNAIDSVNVFITGERADFTQCLMGEGIASRTTNSGNIWSVFPTNLGVGYVYKSISFINSTTGYLTTSFEADFGGRLRKLLKTTNGGVNWTSTTTDSGNVLYFQNNFIRFFDENTGYYINGHFQKTSNGGANWSKFDSAAVYNMKKFSFLNLNTGYIVGRNKLEKTFNGGANWIGNQDAIFAGLNSICAVDTNHVWACGANGKIIYGGDAIAADTASIKYLPLKVGNTWTYTWQNSVMQTGVYKRTITSDSVIDNITYYKLQGLDQSQLITLDSLTGNVYSYVAGYNCPRHPNRKLIDSLAARKVDRYNECSLTNTNSCLDTANKTIFGNTIKSKTFALNGIVPTDYCFAKGFGLVSTVGHELGPDYTDLKGCVLDGVVYGDTSIFSQFKAYLPLEVGNSWTYRRTIEGFPNGKSKITIVADTMISGRRCFKTDIPLPTFNGRIITLDTLYGNIIEYTPNSQCANFNYIRVVDSLNSRIGDSILICGGAIKGRCLDTSTINVFGSSRKTKRFLQPNLFPVSVYTTYATGLGMISANGHESTAVTDTLNGCVIGGIVYGDTSTVSLNSISGFIRFSDNGQPATNGHVKAVKLNTSNGNIITYDSVSIQANGYYFMTGLPIDSLDIVAYPNSEHQADFVPTYYPSSTNWMTAVKVYSGSSPQNINVAVHRNFLMTGEYSVSGWVMPQTNSSSGINDAIVYIKQSTYYRGFFITNSSGVYNLARVIPGDFQIVVNRMGYISPAEQSITIVNSNISNVNFALTPAVGIHQVSTIIPDKFNLHQNYPNPFNPVTNIKFDIQKNSFVKLKVYDIVGKEIAALVNENKSAGSYVVDFDASNLTSGVYFYRIETEAFTETKRMVILK